MSEQSPSQMRQIASYAAQQAARKALGALATRAAALLGAKAGLIVSLAVLLVVVIACALILLLNGISAALQQTTAPWPVAPDVQTDGSYQAGGWAVSSRFGWRASPITGQPEFHDGLDITNPTGGCPFGYRCILPSMFDGVVTYVGWDQSGNGDPATTGGGQIVIVENGNGEFQTLYAHLEPYRLYVQFQGRIRDDYGRYDDYADYQPIGDGELKPAMGNGSIAMWCVNDMPNFRPSRSGATITFLYDRPAACRTSVTWADRGDDWDGWIADDPPADSHHTATLAWQTPLWGERGDRRAGDVALRFRAHLEPPPPPPTATPVTTVIADSQYAGIADNNQPDATVRPTLADSIPTLAAHSLTAAPVQPVAVEPTNQELSAIGYRLSYMNQGGIGQGWNLDAAPAGMSRPLCRAEGLGTTCIWRIADIPQDALPAPDSVRWAGQGNAAPIRAQAATPTPTVATSDTPTPTATAIPPRLSVSISATRRSAPIGGRFSVSVNAGLYPNTGQPIHITINDGGMAKVLDVQTSSGACVPEASDYACMPGAYGTVFVTFVVEVLPSAPKRGLLTFQASAAADGVPAVQAREYVQVDSYVVTPGPWPPPTAVPTATPAWPTPFITYPSPVAYPTVISRTPIPPPGNGPGRSPLACEPQQLVTLSGVVNAAGGTANMRLIGPAAASFAAVRAEINAATGADPLARLADGLRAPEFRSHKAGVALMSWHMTGRAIDLDTGYPWTRVRDGRMWRLYLGSTDVTAIFARHGWNRIPDHADSLEWWHYEYHPDGIGWASAMAQVWPLPRLQNAFPQIAWASVGCTGGANDPIPLPGDIEQCVPGSPSFRGSVEELPGCGPPVQAGDRVYQLESPLGFVGMTGQTTGPHLHLGLRQKDYTGGYPQINICTPEWLQGIVAPADANCWTDMADPLAFLPLAPPAAVASLPEGAPYQLPPPNYPGSLYREPAPDATPVGQYWSPNADGGRYGGGTRVGGGW